MCKDLRCPPSECYKHVHRAMERYAVRDLFTHASSAITRLRSYVPDLTPENLATFQPSGKELKRDNRVRWARQRLVETDCQCALRYFEEAVCGNLLTLPMLNVSEHSWTFPANAS